MYLNTIKYAAGAKTAAKRLGRGIGSGLGKTCGRGHKGQHARAGGFHKLGFEGGQMPIQRRLPKFGFSSLKSKFTEEVRIDVLNKIDAELIDLAILKQKNIISAATKCAKVIVSGKLNKAVRLVGISVTAGARAAIEAAGGSVE